MRPHCFARCRPVSPARVLGCSGIDEGVAFLESSIHARYVFFHEFNFWLTLLTIYIKSVSIHSLYHRDVIYIMFFYYMHT